MNVRVLWSDNANSSFLVFVHLHCFLRLEWYHFSRSESFTSLPHFWRCSRCYQLWEAHHWDCVASSSKFLYSWSEGSYGAVCILMSASLHCLNFGLDHLEERVHHSPFLLSLYWSICALDPTCSVCSKSCLLQLSFSLCHHWFLLNRSPTISIQVCYCISPVKTNKTNKQTNKTQSFLCIKFASRAFPGGPGVKNPPCIAKDTGSIPDPGRFHMWQGN